MKYNGGEQVISPKSVEKIVFYWKWTDCWPNLSASSFQSGTEQVNWYGYFEIMGQQVIEYLQSFVDLYVNERTQNARVEFQIDFYN